MTMTSLHRALYLVVAAGLTWVLVTEQPVPTAPSATPGAPETATPIPVPDTERSLDANEVTIHIAPHCTVIGSQSIPSTPHYIGLQHIQLLHKSANERSKNESVKQCVVHCAPQDECDAVHVIVGRDGDLSSTCTLLSVARDPSVIPLPLVPVTVFIPKRALVDIGGCVAEVVDQMLRRDVAQGWPPRFAMMQLINSSAARPGTSTYDLLFEHFPSAEPVEESSPALFVAIVKITPVTATSGLREKTDDERRHMTPCFAACAAIRDCVALYLLSDGSHCGLSAHLPKQASTRNSVAAYVVRLPKCAVLPATSAKSLGDKESECAPLHPEDFSNSAVPYLHRQAMRGDALLSRTGRCFSPSKLEQLFGDPVQLDGSQVARWQTTWIARQWSRVLQRQPHSLRDCMIACATTVECVSVLFISTEHGGSSCVMLALPLPSSSLSLNGANSSIGVGVTLRAFKQPRIGVVVVGTTPSTNSQPPPLGVGDDILVTSQTVHPLVAIRHWLSAGFNRTSIRHDWYVVVSADAQLLLSNIRRVLAASMNEAKARVPVIIARLVDSGIDGFESYPIIASGIFINAIAMKLLLRVAPFCAEHGSLNASFDYLIGQCARIATGRYVPDGAPVAALHLPSDRFRVPLRIPKNNDQSGLSQRDDDPRAVHRKYRISLDDVPERKPHHIVVDDDSDGVSSSPSAFRNETFRIFIRDIAPLCFVSASSLLLSSHYPLSLARPSQASCEAPFVIHDQHVLTELEKLQIREVVRSFLAQS